VQPDPAPYCPKHMVMGPCGGVRPDGRCEVIDAPCVFPEPVAWPGPTPTSSPTHPGNPTDPTATSSPENTVPPVPLRRPPLILTDYTAEPFSVRALRAVAATLAPASDAVLVGEHQNRPDYPPTLLTQLLREAGANAWITLACRDRNRIVLEQELIGLRHLDVDAVLCVTGDARGYDVRPDVTQVFDLDGPRLAALAATIGLTAAVPETPAAPPRALRPFRLLQKQRAGAAVAVLNHAAVDTVTSFMAAAVSAGLTIPVIAAVAVYTDALSATVLSALPGLELDPAAVQRVIDAPDPVEAGLAAAVAEAEALLAIPGVAGVNLSGLASGRGYDYAARVKADCATRIREVHPR
jgi:methylenetetrahydrofolate reductase (NADPH)